jgi:hypothetical protein
LTFVAIPLDFLVESFRFCEQLFVLSIAVGLAEAKDTERRFVVLVAAAFGVDAAVVVHEVFEILK